MLETHFSGLRYGWERESIRLGTAVLFRGGAVEVTHQGRKYRNYTEPASRPPFVNNPAFRAASFSPREALDLKVLANAARIYEEITGKDVDIEEAPIPRPSNKSCGGSRKTTAARIAAECATCPRSRRYSGAVKSGLKAFLKCPPTIV